MILFELIRFLCYFCIVKKERTWESIRIVNTTDARVSEAANQVGIYELGCYARLFRKQVGCILREYRKLLK